MKKTIFLSIFVGILGLWWANSASAIVISLDANNVRDNATLGLFDVDVDIMVSDLGNEVVTGYDLDLTYEDTLLDFSYVSFSNALTFWGGPELTVTGSTLGAPLLKQNDPLRGTFYSVFDDTIGSVNLFQQALFPPSFFADKQLTPSFSLATATFTGSKNGVNPPLVGIDINSLFGLTPGVNIADQITTSSIQNVPVPTTMALMGMGGVGLALFGWKRKKKIQCI